MKVCRFDGCDKPHGAKGYCYGHYQQLAAGKELKKLRSYKRETLADLLADTEEINGCLEWTSHISKEGYPRMNWQGNTTALVHRVAYVLATGEDITGAQIHHTCANKKCINPEHLQRASLADNVLEMLARRDYEAEIARLQLRIVELEAELEGARYG